MSVPVPLPTLVAELERAMASIRTAPNDAVAKEMTDKALVTLRKLHTYITSPHEAYLLFDQIGRAGRPPVGYRVVYEGSQTTFSRGAGFQASGTLSWSAGPSEVRDTFKRHMDWTSKSSSPFISVFTDKKHAERWARKWSANNGDKPYQIATIDLAKVDVLYCAKALMKDFLFEHELEPEQYEDEYLVLHHIPGESLLKRQHFTPAGGKTRLAPNDEEELAERMASTLRLEGQ